MKRLVFCFLALLASCGQHQEQAKESSSQVRSFAVHQNEVYAGIGKGKNGARILRRTPTGWETYAEFPVNKITVLEPDSTYLYVGGGTPHSKGKAFFGRFDLNGNYELLRTFPHDVIYSAVWYNGKIHIGTASEDVPGSAEIWRFDDPGWTLIGGNGTLGWPVNNTYSILYEMWVHNGELYAGTFSRTFGDGDVLKLTSSGWVDLNSPPSVAVLAFTSYQGNLVISISCAGTNSRNRVYKLEHGVWSHLGVPPLEWEGACIPNHMVTNGDLWLGIGGEPGTTSVWKFAGVNWDQVGGSGINGSWGVLTFKGYEWIYRMKFHNGKLYTGMASDVDDIAQIWEMGSKWETSRLPQ